MTNNKPELSANIPTLKEISKHTKVSTPPLVRYVFLGGIAVGFLFGGVAVFTFVAMYEFVTANSYSLGIIAVVMDLLCFVAAVGMAIYTIHQTKKIFLP